MDIYNELMGEIIGLGVQTRISGVMLVVASQKPYSLGHHSPLKRFKHFVMTMTIYSHKVDSILRIIYTAYVHVYYWKIYNLFVWESETSKKWTFSVLFCSQWNILSLSIIYLICVTSKHWLQQKNNILYSKSKIKNAMQVLFQ